VDAANEMKEVATNKIILICKEIKDNMSLQSEWLENRLKLIADERNPFFSAVSTLPVRDHPETIGELIERWDVQLSVCECANRIFDNLKEEFIHKVKQGENKDLLIKKHIAGYRERKLDRPSKYRKEGYINKGYRWFEEGKTFSLKDFILNHKETREEQVFDETRNKIYEWPLDNYAWIYNRPYAEKDFLDAAEGYAYAKYVHFLTQQNKSAEAIDPMDLIEIGLHRRFEIIEERIKKNETWGTNITCAAFCELLWDNNYFIEKKTRIQTLSLFARWRYGMIIKNQLAAKDKKDRENKKRLLKRYFTY